MKKTDKEIEIEESLRQLVQTQEAKVREGKNGEEYSLTNKGIDKAKELLKDENNQLLLFTLTFNMESEAAYKEHNTPGKFTALKKTLDFMEKTVNPNFYEVFKKAVADGKITGITLNGQISTSQTESQQKVRSNG